MNTNDKQLNASNNSKGVATKNSIVDLLPNRVYIHVASFDARYGVGILAPCEHTNQGHMLFDNGDVIPEGTPVKVTIDYPLTNPVTFEVPFFTGLHPVLNTICEKYREIYREEEETSSVEAGPVGQLNNSRVIIMNRRMTNGKYGIWGHDISELYIEKLELDTAKKELILYVGS